MASIKLAHVVSDIKGSIGGSIFGNTGNQRYLRTKTSQVNRITTAQSKQRSFITSLTQSWRTLSDTQRKLWNGFAENQTTTNRVGDNIQLTGFNWYVKLNSRLFLIAKTLLSIPPLFLIPIGLTATQFTVLHTPAVIVISWQPFQVGQVVLSVFMTPALSTGVKPKPNQFRFVINKNPGGLNVIFPIAEYNAVFGQLGAVGMQIWCILRYTVIETGAVFETPNQLAIIE